jgi:2-deoxy-D-gluconate 3-dehydrogenase
MAMGLATVGANLILLSRSAHTSEAVLAKARAKGVKAAVIACDVMQRFSMENMVEQAVSGFGGIDILINNAAIDNSFRSSPPDASYSLKSVYLLGRAVAQQMIKQGKGGKIVNVAPMTILNLNLRDNGKGGISQMSKVWALELKEYGINVNALEPCRIPAPSWAKESAAPLARMGQSVGPVVFLSSDWADQITGSTLYVNSGWYL